MHVLVHGGAGSPAENAADREAALADAAATGTKALGPTAAVVAAVSELESDPRFNAGIGSAVQSDGQIRTDAGLMDGKGNTGAACAMPDVEFATAVARVVAFETPHVLVSGEHAVSLAETFNIPTERDLWTSETEEKWAELDPPDGMSLDHIDWVNEAFGGTDTVGAVATDGSGIAAATSTGGRWCALAGRVGDVPQIGAGFYASASAAASATGAGEDIAKFGLARRVVEAIEGGETPGEASDRLIDDYSETTGADGGVIAINTDGEVGEAYNTAAMQTAGNDSTE